MAVLHCSFFTTILPMRQKLVRLTARLRPAPARAHLMTYALRSIHTIQFNKRSITCTVPQKVPMRRSWLQLRAHTRCVQHTIKKPPHSVWAQLSRWFSKMFTALQIPIASIGTAALKIGSSNHTHKDTQKIHEHTPHYQKGAITYDDAEYCDAETSTAQDNQSTEHNSIDHRDALIQHVQENVNNLDTKALHALVVTAAHKINNTDNSEKNDASFAHFFVSMDGLV